MTKKSTNTIGEKMETNLKSSSAVLESPDSSLSSDVDAVVAEISNSSAMKNFRHHPDMENFYRFIYENELRFEALEIIDEILVDKKNRKKIKTVKSQAS